MRDAAQVFADRGPYAWFPAFIWTVWAMWLVPDGAEARRPMPLPNHRQWDAANVVDLEAYRQRRRANHRGWNAARPDRTSRPG